MTEIIGACIISLAVLILFSFLLALANAGAAPPLVDGGANPNNLLSQIVLSENQFLHGTSLEAALEIFEKCLWLVGKAVPSGIYMTKRIDVARHHAGNDGAIVIVQVSRKESLVNRGNGIYLFNIQEVEPFKEYHEIADLVPVAIIDSQGHRIR